MPRIRIALLSRRLNKKNKGAFIRSFFSTFIIISLILIPFSPANLLRASFDDLPEDQLYSPYIEAFQEANIIIGDTAGGQPTGNLRPFDQIKRSEFTKITTLIRLLEKAQESGEAGNYQNLDLNAFTLKINESLTDYYKAQPGVIDFNDVDDKELSCASNPEGCEPWYSQYVNYSASHGLVKGFSDRTFKPSDPILRIYALKLLMANDGNKLAYYDDRFSKLLEDPRIENVNVEKCLEGTEDYILKNNGGNNLDAQNLVSYASLADRLDLFGSQCEFFVRAGADTAEKRAALLQKPVTRQEIARYFALTTSYEILKIDHSKDPTTSTKEENGMNFYDKETKKANEKKVAREEDTPLENKEEIKKKKIIEKAVKLNKQKAEMTLEELTTITQEGRCCLSMDLKSYCKKIKFDDYTISEASSYNYETYQGGAWHESKQDGKICWIPLEDIMGGFEEKNNIKSSKGLCSINEAQKSLIDKYDPYYYPRMVREIWTNGNSKELKMFMQIGLDLAIRKSEELKLMAKNEHTHCGDFQNKLEELNSGHIAASLRHLPASDIKIREAELLIN